MERNPHVFLSPPMALPEEQIPAMELCGHSDMGANLQEKCDLLAEGPLYQGKEGEEKGIPLCGSPLKSWALP